MQTECHAGLTKTPNPLTYNTLGQSITYNYLIRNTGNVTLGPAQFTVADDHIGAPPGTPFNCGTAATTLAPNATVRWPMPSQPTNASPTTPPRAAAHPRPGQPPSPSRTGHQSTKAATANQCRGDFRQAKPAGNVH
jgi:hypothetical protein